jgi:23S rRNA-/tRNA-specific pseudouridylate synthase/isopenicillin N synthase-like dioxygenase
MRADMESGVVEPIPYADLESGSADATSDFCQRLHRHGYALVRFAPTAEAEIEALRVLAAGFFALPAEKKRAIGDFRFVGDTYAGYRDSSQIDSEFLEVHVRPTRGTYPPLDAPAGMSAAAAALHARLDGMARLMLRLLAAHIGVAAEAFLALLDAENERPAPHGTTGGGAVTGSGGDGGEPDEPDEPLSSSVLRVCHYRRRADAAASCGSGGKRGGDEDDGEVEVLFDAHTDSSLLTLSTLCPTAPGLQLEQPGEDGQPEWLSVEQLPGVGACDLEVHVGDFLSFLTKDYFASCVHRVTRPRFGPGRLSFPFLVRPRNDHVIDTRPFDPSGANAHLVEVSEISCRELRKLFDARGKRMLDERRTADAAHAKKVEALEAQRRERAAAFRAKLAAGGVKLEDSSEDDEEAPVPAARPLKPTAAAAAALVAAVAPGPSRTPCTSAPLLQGSLKDPRRQQPPSERPPPRTRWSLSDLSALRHEEYLFVFKQHDLHMDHPNELVTLDTQLNACFGALRDPQAAFGFRPVHQLDFATSGVLCVALSKKAAAAASRLFESRQTSKLYLALVHGYPTWDSFTARGAIGEDATDPRGFRMAIEGDPGCTKPLSASTELFVVARGTLDGRPVTKLLMRPKDGRRHQLRLHTRAAGHPIVGDVAYCGDTIAVRMMLHAWRLRLPLPKQPQPLCVTTADPFPIATRAATRAAPASPAAPAGSDVASGAASSSPLHPPNSSVRRAFFAPFPLAPIPLAPIPLAPIALACTALVACGALAFGSPKSRAVAAAVLAAAATVATVATIGHLRPAMAGVPSTAEVPLAVSIGRGAVASGGGCDKHGGGCDEHGGGCDEHGGGCDEHGSGCDEHGSGGGGGGGQLEREAVEHGVSLAAGEESFDTAAVLRELRGEVARAVVDAAPLEGVTFRCVAYVQPQWAANSQPS